jgi:hypothetical protein
MIRPTAAAIGEHVEVVTIPLARRARSRRAFVDVPATFLPIAATLTVRVGPFAMARAYLQAFQS